MRNAALIVLLLLPAATSMAENYQTRSSHHGININADPVAGGYRFDVTITDLDTAATLATPKLAGAETSWSDDNGTRRIRLTLRPADDDLTMTIEFIQAGTLVEKMHSTWSVPPRHILNTTNAVRAGGDVKAPRIIHRVDQVYPEDARKTRVTGAVIVEAVTAATAQSRMPSSSNRS